MSVGGGKGWKLAVRSWERIVTFRNKCEALRTRPESWKRAQKLENVSTGSKKGVIPKKSSKQVKCVVPARNEWWGSKRVVVYGNEYQRSKMSGLFQNSVAYKTPRGVYNYVINKSKFLPMLITKSVLFKTFFYFWVQWFTSPLYSVFFLCHMLYKLHLSLV
jgi:hypothetical protein